MHTHYYVHRSHGTKPMNKLQKEISQFICSLNGKLIHTEDLSNFKKLVLDKIENIQSSNPRCKKMSISFDDSHDKTKIYLSGFYIENLYLYPATLVHVSTLEYKSLSNN